MIKLIKLELRKNKLSPFLKGDLGIFIFCIFMCFLSFFVPAMELADTGVVSPDTEIFTHWNSYISLIATIMLSSYAVLGSVMQSKFTLEEYIGKKSILLFSYPVKRRSILLAKCLLVFGFTAISCFLTTVVAILLFAVVSNIFGLMAANFGIDLFFFLLKISLISSLLSGSITLFALRVGFWKKSLVSVIVTSVILIMPFGNLGVIFPDLSTSILFFATIIYMVVGLGFFAELFAKVDKMEVV